MPGKIFITSFKYNIFSEAFKFLLLLFSEILTKGTCVIMVAPYPLINKIKAAPLVSSVGLVKRTKKKVKQKKKKKKWSFFCIVLCIFFSPVIKYTNFSYWGWGTKKGLKDKNGLNEFDLKRPSPRQGKPTLKQTVCWHLQICGIQTSLKGTSAVLVLC